MKNKSRIILAAFFAVSGLTGFLKAQNDAVPAWQAKMRQPHSLPLIPYADPWREAKPRWLDIDDARYHDFINKLGTLDEFTYHAGQVTLTYDSQQSSGVFGGHLEALGLKPNFAYQIKLCGKPSWGNRGWGQAGDDKTNAALGLAGRWWDDTDQKAGWDAYYQSLYVKAAPKRRHTLVGYLFIGDFISDEAGNASIDFSAATPLHITWQDKQKIALRHHEAGVWRVQSTQSPFRGYGYALFPHSVKLWYEHEKGRPAHINLPPGHYNCRLLITEESFHATTTAGGRWLTVLATEDFRGTTPDSNAANDVSFDMAAANPG